MPGKIIIPLSPELRNQIIDCRSQCEARLAESEKARAAQGQKIKSLEAVETELTTRISVLRPQAIHSDESAGALANAEARLLLVQKSLAELRNAPDRGLAVDLAHPRAVLESIKAEWAEAIPKIIRERLEPFDPPMPPVMQIMGQSNALRQLVILRDYPPQHLRQMFEVFDRALRGQLVLLQDEPVQVQPESLPAQTV